jgi:hypothetical protein
MGIDTNSGKGPRLPKTTTDRPSIIKKEHVTTKLKGSFGSPLCFLASLKRSKDRSLRQLLPDRFELLDADLAHPKLLNLAGHGHRKLLDEFEVTRRLEVGDAFLAPGLQLLFAGAVAGM